MTLIEANNEWTALHSEVIDGLIVVTFKRNKDEYIKRMYLSTDRWKEY